VADHLAALGIGSDSQEERQDQVRRILKNSRPQSQRADSMTLRWTDSSGAELWIYVDETGAMKSVQPHFAGGTRITLEIQEVLERPEVSPFDGGFLGLTQTGGTNPALGSGFPVIFDAPDFPDVKEVFLTARHDVELAAFAVELNAYEAEEAFREARRQLKFAAGLSVQHGEYFEEEGVRVAFKARNPAEFVQFCEVGNHRELASARK